MRFLTVASRPKKEGSPWVSCHIFGSSDDCMERVAMLPHAGIGYTTAYGFERARSQLQTNTTTVLLEEGCEAGGEIIGLLLLL